MGASAPSARVLLAVFGANLLGVPYKPSVGPVLAMAWLGLAMFQCCYLLFVVTDRRETTRAGV